MSNSDSEKWTRFSKLGRTRYVLRFGVLGWGIPTAILFSLVQGYRFGWDGFLFQLIPALILFPIGGIFFGRFMWRALENKHAKDAATGMK
jgi:hypothetical protein